MKKFALLILSLIRIVFLLLKFGKRYDILYTRDALVCLSIFPLRKIYRKKVIYEINGILSEERKFYGQYMLNSLFISFLRAAERFAVTTSEGLIAVTDGLKKYCVKNFGIDEHNIQVIPNGVNTELFRPGYSQEIKNILKDKIGVGPEEKVICHVGNLARWAGVIYLVESSLKIIDTFKEIKFLIIGEGVERGHLQKLVARLGLTDKFIFTGAVKYDEVNRYINISDVCVSPFTALINEKMHLSPLKVYEYAACGKPIVSSRIGGLEFIEKIHCGLLVEAENSDELAEGIITLLKDQQLRDTMGKKGCEYIRKNFSWQKVTEEVEKVLYEVIP